MPKAKTRRKPTPATAPLTPDDIIGIRRLLVKKASIEDICKSGGWNEAVVVKALALDDENAPTLHQMANGAYERASMPSPDGGNRIAQVHVNRGGTTLDRWEKTKPLSDTQKLAIDHCKRLWALAGIHQRTTANYGERVFAVAQHNERRALAEMDARADLHALQDHITASLPLDYWHVFENVCRHDEPAGVAGGRLGHTGKAGQLMARIIVGIVADMVAKRAGLLTTQRIMVA
jgi:hypothetical protein